MLDTELGSVYLARKRPVVPPAVVDAADDVVRAAARAAGSEEEAVAAESSPAGAGAAAPAAEGVPAGAPGRPLVEPGPLTGVRVHALEGGGVPVRVPAGFRGDEPEVSEYPFEVTGLGVVGFPNIPAPQGTAQRFLVDVLGPGARAFGLQREGLATLVEGLVPPGTAGKGALVEAASWLDAIANVVNIPTKLLSDASARPVLRELIMRAGLDYQEADAYAAVLGELTTALVLPTAAGGAGAARLVNPAELRDLTQRASALFQRLAAAAPNLRSELGALRLGAGAGDAFGQSGSSPPLTLERYMTSDVGPVLDPTNESHRALTRRGEELRRLFGDPQAVPRLYFYTEGTVPEPGVSRGRTRYTVRVPANRVYDLGEDPAGIVAQAGADVGAMETAIKAAGYAGYRNTKSARPDIVALFEPVEAIARVDLDAIRTAAFEAARAAEKSEAKGTGFGATYNLRRGDRAYSGDYVVAAFPELTQKVEGKATPEQIEAYAASSMISRLLQDERFSLGIWYDETANTTHLDVSITVPDRELAVRLGRRFNQKAVGYLHPEKGYEEITLAKGEPPDPARRLEELEGVSGYQPGDPPPGLPPPEERIKLIAEIQRVIEIEKNPRAKLPRTVDFADAYARGEYGKDFYNDTRPELERAFGPEDAEQALRFQAAAAAGTEPRAQVLLGLEAFKRWKLGEPIDETIFDAARDFETGKMYRIDPKVRPVLLRQLRQVYEGGMPTGPKLEDYYWAMSGDPYRFVVDRWGWRFFYGKSQGNPAQRAVIQAWGRDSAAQIGVTPRELQAALFFAERGGDDISLRELIRQAIRAKVRDDFAFGAIRDFGPYLDEEGKVNLGTAIVIARALAGAAVGGYVGDTIEERAQNALIGMGFGAVVSPALVKKIAQGARELLKGRGQRVADEIATLQAEVDAAQKAVDDLRQLLAESPGLEGTVFGLHANAAQNRLMRAKDALAAAQAEAAALVQASPPELFRGSPIASVENVPRSATVRVLEATEAERAKFLQMTGEVLPDTEWPGGPGIRQGAPQPALVQVNWATIRDPQRIDELIDTVTKVRPLQEQGTITHEQTRALARELGLTTAQVLDSYERSGRLAARLQAKKDLVVAARNRLAVLSEQLLAVDQSAPAYADIVAEWDHQFGLTAALLQRFLDDASDVGRALNILKGTPQELGDVAGLASLAGKDVSAVPREVLARQVLTLPPAAKTTYFRRLLDAGYAGLETANWAYINSLLFTFEGSVANTLSNVIQITENPILRLGAAGVGTAREGIAHLLGHEGELSRVYWGEPFAQVLGNLTAVPEALLAAWQVVKGSESRFGGIAKETPRFRPSLPEAFPTWTRTAVDMAATLVELPNRILLMAPDEFAKVINYRGEVWAQAYNIVEREFAGRPFAPVLVEEARQRFLDIITNPDRVVKQVATGKTEAVDDIASRIANERTLNEPPTGRLGSLAEGLSHPIVRMLITPFFRVPVNLLRYNMEHVPVLGLAVKRAREDWAVGGERRDLLLAKWALGAGLLRWATLQAMTGEITGMGPLDPNVNALWREQGFQPYSFRVGDKVFSYNRFDALGSLVGMAATYVQLRPYMRPDEADEVAMAMVLAVADNMLSKTFLQGAAEFLELVMARRPQDLEKNRFLKNFVAGYVPSASRQIERHVDPQIRAVYSIFDEVASRVPGYSDRLAPRLNWLTGEPQLAPPGWRPEWLPGWVSLFSPVKVTELRKDPVLQEFIENQISIGPLPPFIYGTNPESPRPPDATQGIPLTSEQHYWYTRFAAKEKIGGKTQYEAIRELMESPEYKKLTPGPHGSRADAIHRVVTGYREMARVRLLQKFPELAEAYRKKLIDLGVLKLGEEARPSLERSMERSGGQLFRSLTR